MANNTQTTSIHETMLYICTKKRKKNKPCLDQRYETENDMHKHIASLPLPPFHFSFVVLSQIPQHHPHKRNPPWKRNEEQRPVISHRRSPHINRYILIPFDHLPQKTTYPTSIKKKTNQLPDEKKRKKENSISPPVFSLFTTFHLVPICRAYRIHLTCSFRCSGHDCY